MATKLIGGVTCAGIAFYARGGNASGIAAASTSFIAGIDIFDICSDEISFREKIGGITLTIGAGVGVNYAITRLCPQLFIIRSLIVLALGVLEANRGDRINNLLHREVSWWLEYAGRSATIAGIFLTAASGLKALGYIK